MEYKFKQESRDFWTRRLLEKEASLVCTNDPNLNRLESSQILNKLRDGAFVLEVGCGNGLLYEEIRERYQLEKYIGTDFVADLVEDCIQRKRDERDDFFQIDMTDIKRDTFDVKFDFVISKRAIQNVLDVNLQLETIDNLGSLLRPGGKLILVESSSDAQGEINALRSRFSLPDITPPFHNLFFDDHKIRTHRFKNVSLLSVDPFASDFYYITRVIYARYADEFLREPPSYDHPLQMLAATMGENVTSAFSQVQSYVFEKL